jgi:Glu-tRNA(Gln) amidotransferase subunit E-like FAD-binding protein
VALGVDARFACFLVGERVRGLRRAAVAVDAISAARWDELFRAFVARPLLREAAPQLLRLVAAQPQRPVDEIVARERLGEAPKLWREELGERVSAATADAYDADQGRRERLALARLMPELRGRVPASEAVTAVREAAGRRA